MCIFRWKYYLLAVNDADVYLDTNMHETFTGTLQNPVKPEVIRPMGIPPAHHVIVERTNQSARLNPVCRARSTCRRKTLETQTTRVVSVCKNITMDKPHLLIFIPVRLIPRVDTFWGLLGFTRISHRIARVMQK